MKDIVHERCFNHGEREAVARCPECHRFFCRECITEHDDKVVCASCLKRLVAAGAKTAPGILSPLLLLQLAAGFLVLWLVFYSVGQALLKLSPPVHEKTLWKDTEL